MKKEYSKIDVPVLIIFFARHDTLEKVFESVREARPSKLLLWQDGPRPGHQEDTDGILKCRKIVEQIDWECEVFRNYQEQNYGCDPSTFYSHKWAFSIVDKCIILEDDMVPSQSYFRFCKELLDKYEFDERINHICGVNPLGKHDNCNADYFFAYNGTGGWASWRRVAQGWDENYSFLDKEYYINNLRSSRGALFNQSYETAKQRRSTGKAFWESILGFNCMLNNRLVIIPRVNLVKNIGVTEGATHGSDLRLLDAATRSIFLQDAQEMDFPLNLQEYVVPDESYIKKYYRLMGIGHPFLRFYRKMEYVFNCIKYGQLIKQIKNRIKILAHDKI